VRVHWLAGSVQTNLGYLKYKDNGTRKRVLPPAAQNKVLTLFLRCDRPGPVSREVSLAASGSGQESGQIHANIVQDSPKVNVVIAGRTYCPDSRDKRLQGLRSEVEFDIVGR
jgi:hypothetical protein